MPTLPVCAFDLVQHTCRNLFKNQSPSAPQPWMPFLALRRRTPSLSSYRRMSFILPQSVALRFGFSESLGRLTKYTSASQTRRLARSEIENRGAAQDWHSAINYARSEEQTLS